MSIKEKMGNVLRFLGIDRDSEAKNLERSKNNRMKKNPFLVKVRAEDIMKMPKNEIMEKLRVEDITNTQSDRLMAVLESLPKERAELVRERANFYIEDKQVYPLRHLGVDFHNPSADEWVVLHFFAMLEMEKNIPPEHIQHEAQNPRKDRTIE